MVDDFDKNIFIDRTELSDCFLSTSIANNQFDVYIIPVQIVTVGDIEIAYKTFGNGTNTILLISGGSNTMHFWDRYLLNELARNNPLIVFDNRGIGDTKSGDKTFSIKQFANFTRLPCCPRNSLNAPRQS